MRWARLQYGGVPAGARCPLWLFQTGLLLVHQLLVIEDLRLEAEHRSVGPACSTATRHPSRLPLSLAGWALVAVDLDHFDRSTTSMAMLAGDRVLAFVGEVLRRHLREGATWQCAWAARNLPCCCKACTPAPRRPRAERLRGDLERLAAQGRPAHHRLGVALATRALISLRCGARLTVRSTAPRPRAATGGVRRGALEGIAMMSMARAFLDPGHGHHAVGGNGWRWHW